MRLTVTRGHCISIGELVQFEERRSRRVEKEVDSFEAERWPCNNCRHQGRATPRWGRAYAQPDQATGRVLVWSRPQKLLYAGHKGQPDRETDIIRYLRGLVQKTLLDIRHSWLWKKLGRYLSRKLAISARLPVRIIFPPESQQEDEYLSSPLAHRSIFGGPTTRAI